MSYHVFYPKVQFSISLLKKKLKVASDKVIKSQVKKYKVWLRNTHLHNVLLLKNEQYHLDLQHITPFKIA